MNATDATEKLAFKPTGREKKSNCSQGREAQKTFKKTARKITHLEVTSQEGDPCTKPKLCHLLRRRRASSRADGVSVAV